MNPSPKPFPCREREQQNIIHIPIVRKGTRHLTCIENKYIFAPCHKPIPESDNSEGFAFNAGFQPSLYYVFCKTN